MAKALELQLQHPFFQLIFGIDFLQDCLVWSPCSSVCVYIYKCVCAKSLHSCPTLCDSMDCSPPCSFVHRILQERILEWVAVSYTRVSFWPRDPTCIGRWFRYQWATWEALTYKLYIPLLMKGNYTSVIISCSICEGSVFREVILGGSLKQV